MNRNLHLFYQLVFLLIPLYCISSEINVFPDGSFENPGISYRPIGDAKGSVRLDESIRHGGRRSLKVENVSGGNYRAYSGQVITLDQSIPKPLKVSFQGMRHGNGKTLAAIDLVIVDSEGSRSYWFNGLTIESDTNGEWVRRESVYNPAKPIRSIEIWPIVNGDPCTVWFDDVEVLTDVGGEDASKREFSIECGKTKIGFEECEGCVSLSSISNGTHEFISKSGIRRPRNLWKVSFRLPDLKCVSVDSGKFQGLEKSSANQWILSWRDLEIPDSKSHFGVQVIIDIRFDGADWRIKVNGGEDILDVAFPCVSGIGPLGDDGTDDYVALPKCSGILLRDYSTVGTVNLTYGAGAPMQCAAFYDADGGLYLSSYDSTMLAKDYSVSRQLDNSLAYSMTTVPPGSVKGRHEYTQPFPFDMRFFSGDWFDAMHIYRRRATRMPWCKKSGRLVNRVNPVLFDCDVWVKGGGGDEEKYAYPDKNIAAIAKLTPEERFKMAGKISAHGTGDRLVAIKDAVAPAGVGVFFSDNWHCFGCLGIEAGRPEYQARRGFVELVGMMNGHGIHLIPYTNFGRWDVLMDGYDERIMIRRSDMSIIMHPTRGSQHAALCHGTTEVRRHWCEMSSKIVDYGCPGIYLDELATNGNPVCFSENHAHDPGDGATKISSQRANVIALKNAVKEKSPNFFTMGEQGCEAYIGANDVNLWWLVSQGDNDIPMFEAVYHDYCIGMCRIPGKWYGPHVEPGYKDKSGDGGMEEFALAIGKCFVHGQQIGLVRDDLAKYAPKATAILADATTLRRRLHPHLLLGTMLRAPLVLHPNDKVPVRQGFAGFITTPSAPILSNAFMADDMSVAAVFFNITDKTQNAFWRVSPCVDWKLMEDNYALTLMDSEGEKALGVVSVKRDSAFTFELPVTAYGCAAVVWRRTNDKATEGLGASVAPEGVISADATPRMVNIHEGDLLFVDLRIANPTSTKAELAQKWNLPQGWRLEGGAEPLSVLHGSEKRQTMTIASAKAPGGNAEIALELSRKDADGWSKSFKWRIEVAAPRRRVSVHRADVAVIASMRKCEALPAGDDIRLAQPRRRYAALDTISAVGRAVYDSQGIYFLFRIDGVPHPVKAMHSSSMWNGCCMQFALNGARLNQPYAISLCLADTVNGHAVFDFMGNSMLPKPDFNFKADGKSLFYFYALPWRDLGYNAPPLGKCVSFSATYNHNDGEKFAGYLEWTPGICGGTNPNEYGDLLIMQE